MEDSLEEVSPKQALKDRWAAQMEAERQAPRESEPVLPPTQPLPPSRGWEEPQPWSSPGTRFHPGFGTLLRASGEAPYLPTLPSGKVPAFSLSWATELPWSHCQSCRCRPNPLEGSHPSLCPPAPAPHLGPHWLLSDNSYNPPTGDDETETER